MNDKRIVVVIPTYNEAENVRNIVPQVLTALPGADVLIVDDSSPDGTGDIVKEMALGEPRIGLLSRRGKEGLGKAYIAGFKRCLQEGYDIIFQMDCDFSHQPSHLAEFMAAIQDNDFVIGSRYMPGGRTTDWGFHRKFLSRGGNLYARIILGVKVSDLTGGFKCWRREVLEGIDLDTIAAAGYAFQMEMTFRALKKGFRLKEIPIVFPDRTKGESKLVGGIFWESLGIPFRIRFGSRKAS
ncbi:MAG TPA: polyprenol monophosphomannose synthase [Myxococcota bacterium]|nr:polyprenol monophosphomannose synthase [Myxococcota bacterium]HOD07778.1 polyprenol monophosphomannose synthase [Myxococcota bacterium]HPB49798.1 polyprenol monophosphomannose synthase [Myxococcota bacterium]HQP95559.1 polyprenol monophosphomannose synthase [Myxococcota bacterium]